MFVAGIELTAKEEHVLKVLLDNAKPDDWLDIHTIWRTKTLADSANRIVARRLQSMGVLMASGIRFKNDKVKEL